MRSCGRFGPASDGSTLDRLSSDVLENDDARRPDLDGAGGLIEDVRAQHLIIIPLGRNLPDPPSEPPMGHQVDHHAM